MRPLLVGEVNPYGSRPSAALFPHPVNSAGWRLCHTILNLTPREYLRRFSRTNLCSDKWSREKARERATYLRMTAFPLTPMILLGKKVCQAFNVPFYEFTVQRTLFHELYILPHPSGRNRFWNEPASIVMARKFLEEFLC